MEDGVAVLLSDEEEKITRTLRLVMDADEIQMSGEHFKEELSQWLRFNSAEARKTRDGLGHESIGTPGGPRWLGSFFLKHLDIATTRAERDKKLIESSPAIALFMTREDSKVDWVNVGRSFERVALWATTMNIQHAHLNQPLEIPDLRPEVQRSLNGPNLYPQLLLRMGYAKPMTYSLRRSIEDILIETVDTLLPDRAAG